MITSWSYSRLLDFETCAFRAYLKHVERIPEPQRPLAPGKTEQANDRGTRIHQLAEDFVRNGGKLPPELGRFEEEFTRLRELYGHGVVSLEGEWGLDTDWSPTDWRKAWGRVKLDAIPFMNDTEAAPIDYKTGRKFGNEIKHAEQLRLYAIAALLRFPTLEKTHCEVWYLDLGEITTITLTRDQALRFKTGFERRITKMVTCQDFKPEPNKFNCKWCEYGPWNGGQCQVGVR